VRPRGRSPPSDPRPLPRRGIAKSSSTRCFGKGRLGAPATFLKRVSPWVHHDVDGCRSPQAVGQPHLQDHFEQAPRPTGAGRFDEGIALRAGRLVQVADSGQFLNLRQQTRTASTCCGWTVNRVPLHPRGRFRPRAKDVAYTYSGPRQRHPCSKRATARAPGNPQPASREPGVRRTPERTVRPVPGDRRFLLVSGEH